MSDSLSYPFCKTRHAGEQVTYQNKEVALEEIAKLCKGKLVEIIFPCSQTGKLNYEFYEVSSKGRVTKMKQADVRGLF